MRGSLYEAHIKALFPLAPANQLAHFGHQQVHGRNCLVILVEAHVEGLHQCFA